MSAPPVVARMLAEAGLSADDDLATLLTALHALGDGPPPAPTPELAERLGVTAPPRPRRWLRRRLVGGATALALAAVSGTGVAAAANELPPGVQRLMARLSEQFLPFDFPPPAESGPVPARDGTSPADRTHEDATGTRGERPSGTDRATLAAQRSHHPAVLSGSHPAGTDDGPAQVGGDGTRSTADGVETDGGSGGDSGDGGSRDGDDSRERTGAGTPQGSESGTDGTPERTDGSGGTDDGSDDHASGSGDGSDPDAADSPDESDGSTSGGG